MSSLTKEQKERIEENRRKALEKIAHKNEIEKKKQVALKLEKTLHEASRNTEGGTCPRPPPARTLPDTSVSGTSTPRHQPNPFISQSRPSLPVRQHRTSGAFVKNKYQHKQTPVRLQNPQASNFTLQTVVSGECCLVSKSRFQVEMPYHAKTIDIFKSMGSSLYDAKTKKWSFSTDEHDKLMTELRVLAGEVSVRGIPKTVLKLFAADDPVDKAGEIDLSPIDPELLDHLMPFQEVGVRFGIAKGGRCLIADDMGLGKTIQALGIASYYRSDWPLIIVCPTSVRYHWLEAIRTWLPGVPDHTATVMTTSRDVDRDAAILITSYSLVSRACAALVKCSFGFAVLDESHFVKNQTSARTKAVAQLARGCRRVVLLSGTPALSRPVELFPQLAIIDSRTFCNMHDFGLRYCSARFNPLGFWDYSGASNMPELHLLLRRCCMVRRLKADVLGQLPAKLRQVVMLKPKGVSRSKQVLQFEKQLSDRSVTGMKRRGKLLEYYAVTGACKIPVITEYLSEQLETPDRKFLVFAHHQKVLDGISELLVGRRVDFIRIDGSTSPVARKELCDRFQYDDRCTVAVLSITAANTGITLTSAQLVIFAELFWNPGVLIQAEDRAHRIGQMDGVTVRYLVAPGTADDHLWPLVQCKLDVLNRAGLSKDNFVSCQAVGGAGDSQTCIRDFFSALDDCLDDGNDDALLAAAQLMDQEL